METAYSNFWDSLRTEATQRMYSHSLDQFKGFARAKTYKSLTKVEVATLQDMVIRYIKHMKEEKLAPLSMRLKLAAIKHFYVMNDVVLNWPKIMKFVGSSRIVTKDRIYTKEEIRKVLDKCDERKRVMFLLLVSTGIRIGAMHEIKLKDLTKIEEPNVYRLVVYAGEPEEYVTFTSIECAKAIDSYLEYRRRFGEEVKPDSPLIREQFDPASAKHARPLSRGTIIDILTKEVISAGVRTPGKGRIRHEVMLFHGFRKFANTMMSQAGLKQVIKEMLLGHRVGLEKNYLRPSDQELLSEYMKAIDLLTISEEKQLQVKVEKLQLQNDQLIQILRDKVAALERANETRQMIQEPVTVATKKKREA